MFTVWRYGNRGRYCSRAVSCYHGSSGKCTESIHATKPAQLRRLCQTRSVARKEQIEADIQNCKGTTPPPSHPSLVYPDSRSAKHNNLSSFLRHAERTGLDSATTTYVGTHYEYTVAEHLVRLGFSLQRVGGASDNGIDLLGTWSLPLDSSTTNAQPSSPIRVLVQCKAGVGQRIGPHLIRELEGAFVGAPAGWRLHNRALNTASDTGDAGLAEVVATPPVLGILVTEKPATKGIRDALTRSRWPMAFIYCSGADGHIRQMLWNQRAEEDAGLSGLGVTLHHSRDDDKSPNLALTWQGKRLPYVIPE